VLEGTKFGTAFLSAKDVWLSGVNTKDAKVRGCVKGACEKDMCGGVGKPCASRSRPLALMSGQ